MPNTFTFWPTVSNSLLLKRRRIFAPTVVDLKYKSELHLYLDAVSAEKLLGKGTCFIFRVLYFFLTNRIPILLPLFLEFFLKERDSYRPRNVLFNQHQLQLVHYRSL